MSNITMDGKADSMLSRLQDTDLDPMEEALFQSWTKANQIDKPDEPGDEIDYRGIWKTTGGAVLPHGQLKRFSEQVNDENKLERILHQKMMDRITEITGKKEDQQNQLHKEERQDITHKQKLEMEKLKMKQAPHELRLKEHDVRAKEFDVQKQHIGIEAQKVGNEGKKIDIIGQLVAPKPAGVGSASGSATTNSNKQK
jgi:hypothetical protein